MVHGDSGNEDRSEAGGQEDEDEDTATSQHEANAALLNSNAGNTGSTSNITGGCEAGDNGGCGTQCGPSSRAGGTVMVTWKELRATRVVSADGTSRYFVAIDGAPARFVSCHCQALPN